MRRLGQLIPALVLLFIAILADAAVSPQERRPRHRMDEVQPPPHCPMMAEDTRITLAETATGVVLTIRTTPERVAELQHCIGHMSTTPPSSSGAAAAEIPPARVPTWQAMVAYESIEDGARLTLTPMVMGNIAQFRAQVRAQVERMQAGDCRALHEICAKGEIPGAEAGCHHAGHDSHHPAEP